MPVFGRIVVLTASVLALSLIMSFSFLWTYLAGWSTGRSILAQRGFWSACGGAVSAALVLVSLFQGRSRQWQLGLIASQFVIVGICGTYSNLMMSPDSWSTRALAWLVVAPLAVMELICLQKIVAGAVAWSRYLAVVVAGFGIGCALLGDAGSILPLAVGAAGGVLVLTLRRVKTGYDLAKWTLPLWSCATIIAALWVIFGVLKPGWGLAVLATITATCLVAVRHLVFLWEDCSRAEAPKKDCANKSELRRVVGLSGGEMLFLSWVILVFNLLCWTEPSLVPEPFKPMQLNLPRMPKAQWDTDYSASANFAMRMAQVDAYSGIEALAKEQRIAMADYELELDSAKKHNAPIEKEVEIRMGIKLAAMIMIPSFTWLYGYSMRSRHSKRVSFFDLVTAANEAKRRGITADKPQPIVPVSAVTHPTGERTGGVATDSGGCNSSS